jgi:hypothetical protein
MSVTKLSTRKNIYLTHKSTESNNPKYYLVKESSGIDLESYAPGSNFICPGQCLLGVLRKEMIGGAWLTAGFESHATTGI